MQTYEGAVIQLQKSLLEAMNDGWDSGSLAKAMTVEPEVIDGWANGAFKPQPKMAHVLCAELETLISKDPNAPIAASDRVR